MRSKWTSALVFHEKRPVWRAPFAHRSRARSGSARRRSISATQPRGDFGSAKSAAAAVLRQARSVGRDDWAAQGMASTAGSPNRSSATERRSKTLFERLEISSVTKPSMCTLEGGGREFDRGEIHARKIDTRCPRQPRYPIPMRQVPAMENSISTFLCTARPTSKKTKGR